MKKWLLAAFGRKPPRPPRNQAFVCGTKYTVDEFPAFYRSFPQNGLPVGKGKGLYWINPVRVEFKDYDFNGVSSGDELICTFSINFRDGLRGEAGYMDRIKPDGDFSRWHIYPCGDIISADLYQDHRIKHDIFRSLMGKILLGEIYPDSYMRTDLSASGIFSI